MRSLLELVCVYYRKQAGIEDEEPEVEVRQAWVSGRGGAACRHSLLEPRQPSGGVVCSTECLTGSGADMLVVCCCCLGTHLQQAPRQQSVQTRHGQHLCTPHCHRCSVCCPVVVCAVCAQVDGSTGNKFQSVAELIATEKAARAARRGGAGVQVSEEETVRGCKHGNWAGLQPQGLLPAVLTCITVHASQGLAVC